MRDPGARQGASPVEVSLRMLARSVERLAQRMQRIEASNRTVPPDTVLERELIDDQLYVYLRRVSTDERWQVVPPAATTTGTGGVSQQYVDDAIAAAIDAIVFPPAGVSATYVSNAISTALAGYTAPLPSNGVLVYTFVLGGGTGTYVVSHSFGSRDFVGACYRTTSPYDQIQARIEHTSTTTATVYLTPTPAVGAVQLVLLGA